MPQPLTINSKILFVDFEKKTLSVEASSINLPPGEFPAVVTVQETTPITQAKVSIPFVIQKILRSDLDQDVLGWQYCPDNQNQTPYSLIILND